jgi:hypothetical protein
MRTRPGEGNESRHFSPGGGSWMSEPEKVTPVRGKKLEEYTPAERRALEAERAAKCAPKRSAT